MSNDADSHELLAVVAAIHHERIGEALDDGAVGLSEALDGIAASGVGDVDGGADLDVVAVGEDPVSENPCQLAHKAQEKSIRAHGIRRLCSRKLQSPVRVLTSMRYLGLRHPRTTTC